MSKLQAVRQMDETQPQREMVRTLAELQKQIEALQPQHQVQTALDDLAAKIEPLAQAMVTLTEETRQTLTSVQAEAAKHQQVTAKKWSEAAQELKAAAKDSKDAASKAEAALEAIREAQASQTWRTAGFAALVGTTTAALTVASLIYLLPPQLQQPINLDSATVARMIVEAMRQPQPQTTPRR